MPSDWRNTKKRDAAPSEMVGVRVPSDLKAKVEEIAEAGNSTLAAAVRWGLEKFIEENPLPTPRKAAAKAGLFD